MNDKQFESLAEHAMLEIAQAQISDKPHRFSPDFTARIMQKAAGSEPYDKQHDQETEQTGKQPFMQTRSSKSVPLMPKILTWGSLAASFLIALSVGAIMLHQQNDMRQLSSVPVEIIENTSVPVVINENTSVTSDLTDVSNDYSGIERTQTKTVTTMREQDSQTELNTTGHTAYSSGTGVTGTSITANATIPTTDAAATALQLTGTMNTATESKQAYISEEILAGDFDLDGHFTPADCAWAYLIRQASQSISVVNMLPLTDDQREQCALISYEELSRIDSTGDAQQRIEPDTEFYTSADVFDQNIPLSSLEFAAVMETGRLAYTYKLFPDLNVREYLDRQGYYNDCLAEIQNDPPALNMQEQEKWITLRNMSVHYIHDLQIEKNNETHEAVFRAGDDEPFGDVTWEQLLAELNEAKSWNGCIRFTLTALQDRFYSEHS